jgi:hypothetical protein
MAGGRVGLQPSLQQHKHRDAVAGWEEIRKEGRESRGMKEAENNKGEHCCLAYKGQKTN